MKSWEIRSKTNSADSRTAEQSPRHYKLMSKTFFFLFISLFYLSTLGAAVEKIQKEPLPVKAVLRGHAHNDYLHPHPCFDALDNGFCSIEADVFLVKDKLLVAHFFLQLHPQRSLETLYLKPLRERTRRFNGKVFPDAETFYLWIELKTEARQTYDALHKIFEQYADILTRYENGKAIPGAVTVILTGNAKLALIQDKPLRYAGVDGVRYALDSDVPAHLVPTVSLNWREEFPQFKGKLTAAEQEKLADQVRKAHQRGRKLRYWNAPDQESFWKILSDADVDFINTDHLEPLRKFLTP